MANRYFNVNGELKPSAVILTCPCGKQFPRSRSQVSKCAESYCSKPCHYKFATMPLGSRLWAKVNKNGPTKRPELGPCWLWEGGTAWGVYGVITIKKRPTMTHRVSWEIANGPIPEGLCVLHRCDIPLCCRPDHLFLGTKRDNMHDAISKGRWIGGYRYGFSKKTVG